MFNYKIICACIFLFYIFIEIGKLIFPICQLYTILLLYILSSCTVPKVKCVAIQIFDNYKSDKMIYLFINNDNFFVTNIYIGIKINKLILQIIKQLDFIKKKKKFNND